MARKKTSNPPDPNQYDLLTKDISTQIKQRLRDIIRYDYRRLPYRVASTVQSDMSRIAWFDGETFYYGNGDGDINSMDKEEFKKNEKRLPNPIYRGQVSFYPIKGSVDFGGVILNGLNLDEGYIEFFIDMLCGTLGVYQKVNGHELWRRFDRITQRVENIETFYGVRKGVAGVYEICIDIILECPWLAPLEVMSGIAIGDTVYGGLAAAPLTNTIIPKHIVDEANTDIRKAEMLYRMICPDAESRHNLLLATVYPYFRRANEKFFILKGPGGNGKSKYLSHFEALIGGKFDAVDLDGMISSGFDRNNAIARLQGKLVVNAPEVKLENPRFMAELKRIATGDRMVARTIGNDSYSFRSEATLFIDTNESVELGNTDAIMRRMVGISFVDRRLSWEEMEPYADWMSSIDGACSLFLYAYYYYIEECESKFTWFDVDVNEGDAFTDQMDRVLSTLIDRAQDDGWDKAYVRATELSNASKKEKMDFLEDYGLKYKSKRINGDVVRAIMIENERTFHSMCKKRGYFDEAE